MKLAILGGTGKTGLLLVQQAVDAGHEVTAIMRNTDDYPVKHDNVKVINENIHMGGKYG